MDFFDMVPDNFFSLLNSKNKKIYLASILQAFKIYETGSILGIEKKIVVDDLVFYLESNKKYLFEVEDEEDEESNPQSKRDLANYILRKMEECGWIYVDVTNDYQEVLNFTDCAITLCEAILNAYPSLEYTDDELPDNYVDQTEYQGYIYNIYSLLTQKDNIDYSLTFSLVYSNTRQLIRAIRKLDARMKDYIQSVVDNTEVKDLMEKLMNYQTEIYNKSYAKLKISDNIDRYRLEIITKLEEYQQSESIVKAISNNYLTSTQTVDDAINKTIKNIDEVIDAFNALEEFITEIDNKNRDYINSTIGKVKFLLSEDDNIIGKINRILKYVKTTNSVGKIDKSLKLVDSLYTLSSIKVFDQEKSLYTPRGVYERNENQILDDIDFEFDLNKEFLEQFKTHYDEKVIDEYLNEKVTDEYFLRASMVITPETEDEEFMMVLFALMYAADKNYSIEILDTKVQSKNFIVKDFIIRKK